MSVGKLTKVLIYRCLIAWYLFVYGIMYCMVLIFIYIFAIQTTWYNN